MTREQIDYMVQRFLSWQLPDDFDPDNGINYSAKECSVHMPPVGTNLFTAIQAQDMIRYMTDGLPQDDDALKKTNYVISAPGPRYFSLQSDRMTYVWTLTSIDAVMFDTKQKAEHHLKILKRAIPELFVFIPLLGEPEVIALK